MGITPNEKYSSVRVDRETLEKLNKLSEQIRTQLGFQMSKTQILKVVVNEVYDNNRFADIIYRRLKRTEK